MPTLKALVQEAGGRIFEGFWMPYEMLDIEPGFNGRIPGPELDAHVEWLAGQIDKNGFDITQPLAVERNGERAWVRKGHCRHAAVTLLRSRGRMITAVPCIPEPKGTNDVMRVYQIGTSNGGKNLGYLEYAGLVMRLRGMGQTDDQIVTGYGKDKAWLSRVLDLSAAPVEVRAMVTTGEVGQVAALTEVRRNGGDAVRTLRAAKERSEARGDTKVRPRDIEAVQAPHKEPPSRDGAAMAAAVLWKYVLSHDRLPQDFIDAMNALHAKYTSAELQAAREQLKVAA